MSFALQEHYANTLNSKTPRNGTCKVLSATCMVINSSYQVLFLLKKYFVVRTTNVFLITKT